MTVLSVFHIDPFSELIVVLCVCVCVIDRKAEWDELANEVYQYRRLRKGKINKTEFEALVGE